ncbi:MAG: hypothetical protein ACYDCO_18610 [Armatimonadota bacterium]
MPYGGRHTSNADRLDGLDSTDFVRVADIATTVGDPGADEKVPSEQAVREAIAAIPAGSDGTPSPNLLDNPEFAIDQRHGGAARAVADDAYGMDRWNLLADAGTPDVERLASGLHTASYAGRVTLTAMATRAGFAQIVESTKSLPYRGQTLQLQARVRHAFAVTIHWAILEWTGAADSVISDVVHDWTSSTYTAGQFFSDTTLTVAAHGTQAVPANTWTPLAGAAGISTSCHNLIVMIWSENPGAFDVTETDLFAGSATRTWRPKDPAADLVNCQRYCFVLPTTDFRANGYKVSSTLLRSFEIRYPVTMRAAPAATHNITAWAAAPPTGTQVAVYEYGAGAYVTISGALSIVSYALTTYGCHLGFTAGTSFSGTGTNSFYMTLGSDVRWVFSADL